jgi:DnaJ-class molecular chaperone
MSTACTQCKGTGQVPGMKQGSLVTCPVCKGTGEESDEDFVFVEGGKLYPSEGSDSIEQLVRERRSKNEADAQKKET